ncbi:unnamed protein product [Cylicostephanus goldi]|uniref:NR LBD domain-containing protein n=1 Tax=Cylicostephanus goldi TaxID=71465 RepID=A0A3P6SR78_CYLGO|nr:unnamed protein product [Cylicostephanus goldi]
MGKPIPLEHVINYKMFLTNKINGTQGLNLFFREAGPLVEKFTTLLYSFSKMRITTEAYVCIKAITLFHYNRNPDWSGNHLDKPQFLQKVTLIQDQLPMLHNASSVLLHSKMFYVPFLICKNPHRFAGQDEHMMSA